MRDKGSRKDCHEFRLNLVLKGWKVGPRHYQKFKTLFPFDRLEEYSWSVPDSSGNLNSHFEFRVVGY